MSKDTKVSDIFNVPLGQIDLETLSHLAPVCRIYFSELEEYRKSLEKKQSKVDGVELLIQQSIPGFRATMANIEALERLLSASQIVDVPNEVKELATSAPPEVKRRIKNPNLAEDVLKLVEIREMNQAEICDELNLEKKDNYRSYFTDLFFKSGKMGRRLVPTATGTTKTYMYASREYYRKHPEENVEYPENVIREPKKPRKRPSK